MTLQFSMFLILMRWVVWHRRVGRGREGFTEPTEWMCIVDESARVCQWPLHTQVLVSSVKKMWTKFYFSQARSSCTPKKTKTHRQTNSVNILSRKAWNKMIVYGREQGHTCEAITFQQNLPFWHWNTPFTQFVHIQVMWFQLWFFPSVWSLQVCKLVSEYSKT